MKKKGFGFMIAFLLFLFMSVAGCSIIGGDGDLGDGIASLPNRIAGKALEPIFKITRADAETTLRDIDAWAANGEMDPTKVAEAKACPLSIIETEDFYKGCAESLGGGSSTPRKESDFHGVIWQLEKLKYAKPKTSGKCTGEEGRTMINKVIASCGALIPSQAFTPSAGGIPAGFIGR